MAAVATSDFVNPQFSTTVAEAAASQIIGSLTLLDQFPLPVYNQVDQEQIAADQESVELVQQHTVQKNIHVSIPQTQEQILNSVQVILRELFLER